FGFEHRLARGSGRRQTDGRFGGQRAERADAIDVAAEDFFDDAGGAVDHSRRLMIVPRPARRGEPTLRAHDVEHVAEHYQVDAVDRAVAAVGAPRGTPGQIAEALAGEVDRSRR